MRRIFQNSIALMVVVIVMFLIVPLDESLLDILIIINISLSIVILMVTMTISEALEFSIFPSLLLITTLFRLGLNVSTTRSILSYDGSGEVGTAVIRTFGQLITQGNVVLGIIIFFIIVLVQFIVITKGAERVAEVAARFTLDAMPGKQMAIDADLSSGLINEQQARERRSKIQREADFYGAMDGATKFVKGDATLSLIITAINLVGGLILWKNRGNIVRLVKGTESKFSLHKKKPEPDAGEGGAQPPASEDPPRPQAEETPAPSQEAEHAPGQAAGNEEETP